MVALTCRNIKKVEAHPALLNIYYEDPATATGAWYYIGTDNDPYLHFYGSTVKYLFGDENNDPATGSMDWCWITSYYTAEEVATLQNAVVESMKKWDKIYIAKKVNGEPVKSKLINFALGTMDNYNLLIIPDRTGYIGIAGIMDIPLTRTIISDNHGHAERYWMYLMLPILGGMKNANDKTEYEIALTRVGAHEFGHMLGLMDIDVVENGYDDFLWEHNNKIMGYAQYGEYTDYCTTISYYDIIGAGITTGLHTDNDHKWRIEGTKDDLTVLECYICNGRIDLQQNANGTFGPNNFTAIAKRETCSSSDHSSTNMELVACTPTSDFMKCKNCDFYRTYPHSISGAYHFTIDGHYQDCNYCGEKFMENHDFVLEELYYVCSVCNYRSRVRTLSTDDGEYLYSFSDDASESLYDISQAEMYILENDNYDITEKIEVLEELSTI